MLENHDSDYQRESVASELGREAAFVSNKCRETGCIGTSDVQRIDAAYTRLHDAAVNADDSRDVFRDFAQAFESTINRTLNADWRMEVPVPDDEQSGDVQF